MKRKNIIIGECENCGQQISSYPSYIRKYCSDKCSRQHYRGINHARFKYRVYCGKNNRYYEVFEPDHPFANCNGYVREHRIVMEKKLHRLLLPFEVVHHIDGNGHNNDPSNLKLFYKIDHDKFEAQRKSKRGHGEIA